MYGNAHLARPKNILFVINTPINASDTAIQSMLINNAGDFTNTGNANNNVTTVDDAAIPGSLVGYDLIVVSESVVSTTVGTTFLNTEIPVVITEPALIDDMQMSSVVGTAAAAQTQIDVTDTNRLGPYAGNTTVYTAANTLFWVLNTTLGSGAQSLASIVGAATEIVAFMYEKGASGNGGFVMPERRLYVGYVGATLTASGMDILKIMCEFGLYVR